MTASLFPHWLGVTGPTIAVADEAFPINMPMITASATAAA
jgi:hypothetical protein